MRARKGRDESFSDVILRLTERMPLVEYAGLLSKSSVKAIREAIEEARSERRNLDLQRVNEAQGLAGPNRAEDRDNSIAGVR